ncbi:MAG TPA: hypothetical protein VEU96_12515 [Bryobacteraceae bacterium]|nr:hypothetical protein [Bryobacteraceae bacterium]
MSGKTVGWVLFLLGLLLLSLAATPYSRAATVAMMSLRLGIIALVSVLTLRERYKNRDDRPRASQSGPDAGEKLLQRMRHWYYDEKNPK